jgi:glucose-1-phosphate cytidylyltransferase
MSPTINEGESVMKVVLLAGGLGTRIQEETDHKPKPMVEIGGKPLLTHIMRYYASYGFKNFAVALGYKGEVVKNYFLNYRNLGSSLSIDLKSGDVTPHSGDHDDWNLELVDTGLDVQTGGRVKRLAPWLKNETFMLTYGDGLSDVPLDKLLKFHKAHGKLATVTAVRPPARFGSLYFEGDLVTRFEEKPQLGEGWINGGFFILEPEVLEFIKDDETIWERGPLEILAQKKQLVAYKHDGYWQCMDTLRDLRSLEELWGSGRAPWKVT